MVKVASSVTLEGIVATQFNADEGMKAAFAQSILDRSNGAFDEVIDIVAGGVGGASTTVRASASPTRASPASTAPTTPRRLVQICWNRRRTR